MSMAKLTQEIAEASRAAMDRTDTLKARAEAAEAALGAVSAAIGSVRWMDPPDGGSVTLAEQVQRMRDDLSRTETALAYANDAAAKGAKGREIGTALECCVEELSEARAEARRLTRIVELQDQQLAMWQRSDLAEARLLLERALEDGTDIHARTCPSVEGGYSDAICYCWVRAARAFLKRWPSSSRSWVGGGQGK